MRTRRHGPAIIFDVVQTKSTRPKLDTNQRDDVQLCVPILAGLHAAVHVAYSVQCIDATQTNTDSAGVAINYKIEENK